MSGKELRDAVGRLRRAVSPDRAGNMGDAELLARWASARDEAAFEALVWRHGPMVLGLCRRLLRDAHEAEDAFQAAFLALARQAGSVGTKGAVAGWLYRVAYRVALHARGRAERRPCPDAEALALVPARPEEDPCWHDLRPVLDEEVARLPEVYRLAFVLCQLQGRTNEEAARELGCPVGTVLSRLARARGRLRDRLTRRGLAPAVAALAAASATSLSAAVPHPLAMGTVGLAGPFALNQGAALTPAAAHSTILAEGVLRGLAMAKWKIAASLLLTLGLLGTGAGAVAYRLQAGERPASGAQTANRAEEVRAGEEPPAPPKAPVAAPPRDSEDPQVTQRKLAQEKLTRAEVLLKRAEADYQVVEENWSATSLKLRVRLIEIEERVRALERAQAAERERELSRLKAAEAALDTLPGPALREHLAKLEDQSRSREEQRVRNATDARLGLVQAEEALRQAEREQATRRSLAQGRLNDAAARLARAESGAEEAPQSPADLERNIRELTREVGELRKAVERLRLEKGR